MKAIGDVGAGHTLGRYELLVPIARGGMAVVWAARMKGTRGFQKLVAIKSMLPSLADDDGTFEEMFLSEAQLAAQIHHPNVCEILDLGEQDGVLFIVMEWVDGEPLGTLHKVAREKGGMPIAISTRIGLAVANGLHAAHELKSQETGESFGLVHRDVSPQNILTTYDGNVKVVDFGVAKATSSAAMNRTAIGQMKGKVTYMAPEQARGEPIDRRADVFALGIVLYQLVTSRHPFKGETPLKTLDRICDSKAAQPPIQVAPTCHPALNVAIVKALEKDRTKRFATMDEFAHALEGVLSKMVTRGNDLAPFVKNLVGDRGDKRRELIREALRTADDRKDRPPVHELKNALAAPTAGATGDETGRTPGASSFSAPGESSSPSRPSEPSPSSPPSPPSEPPRPSAINERQPTVPALPSNLIDRPSESGRPTAPTLLDPELAGQVPVAVEDIVPSEPPRRSEIPPSFAAKSDRPVPVVSLTKKKRKSRAWVALVALAIVAGGIGVVAVTMPGALERGASRLGVTLPLAHGVRPNGAHTAPPPAPAAPGPSAAPTAEPSHAAAPPDTAPPPASDTASAAPAESAGPGRGRFRGTLPRPAPPAPAPAPPATTTTPPAAPASSPEWNPGF